MRFKDLLRDQDAEKDLEDKIKGDEEKVAVNLGTDYHT